jgi:hypothetical protein
MFAERLQNLMKAIHAGQLDHLRSAAMESAKELGRKYQQDAIIWTGPDSLAKPILLR